MYKHSRKKYSFVQFCSFKVIYMLWIIAWYFEFICEFINIRIQTINWLDSIVSWSFDWWNTSEETPDLILYPYLDTIRQNFLGLEFLVRSSGNLNLTDLSISSLYSPSICSFLEFLVSVIDQSSFSHWDLITF